MIGIAVSRGSSRDCREMSNIEICCWWQEENFVGRMIMHRVEVGAACLL